MADPAITTTYRIPPEVHAWLVAEAQRRGTSQLRLVVELLRSAMVREQDRTDYISPAGIASWWAKDGAWHIAITKLGQEGFYWTDDAYETRSDAIAAIATATG